MAEVPKQIAELIAKFDQNLDAYHTAPAFQLRRYAWSAKLPLSILTNFEAFAVYDCRIKPDQADRASTARLMRLTD